MDHKTKTAILRKAEVKRAAAAVGGLGAPSKMPGFAYGIDSSQCPVGALLAKKPGSVCHGCYTFGGNYRYPSVIKAQAARMATMANLDAWKNGFIATLATVAKYSPEKSFRFHDSGDVQSVDHARAIIAIAAASPDWRFWLPTKEYGKVPAAVKLDGIPSNLTIRVSAPYVNSGPPPAPAGCVTSTVYDVHAFDIGPLPEKQVLGFFAARDTGWKCPALTQGNACQDCRACWDGTVSNICYPKH